MSYMRKIILGVCVIMLFITGCAEKNGDYSGFGNTMSNISNGGKCCETSDKIYFLYGHNIIYTLDKKSLAIETLCKKPECGHYLNNPYCLSGKFAVNMQCFNDNLHYADLSYEGYFEMNKGDMNELIHTGDLNLNTSAMIYNGKIYYAKADESIAEDNRYMKDIYYRAVDEKSEKKINVGEHIMSIIPQEEYIYFLTEEYMLYRIDYDGNKMILNNKRIYQVIPWENKLYYIVGGEGLYCSDLDGTDEKMVYSDVEYFAINEEYIYLQIDGLDNKGFMVMNKKGDLFDTGKESMLAYTFKEFDKILLFDMGDNERSCIYLMNKDGSGLERIQLPEEVDLFN